MEPNWRLIYAEAYRFCVRTLRIAIGGGIGYLAFQLLDWGLQTLNLPFAKLSPMQLIGSIFAGLIGLSIAVLALWVAFGEGDRREIVRLEAELKAAQTEGRRKSLGYEE